MAKPTDTLARRGDGCVRAFTAAGPWQRSDVVENEGESEVDLRGEARGPREEWGRVGGGIEEAGALAILSPCRRR